MTAPTTGRGGTAVVIGASIAGLLAARVLTEHMGRAVVGGADRPRPAQEFWQACAAAVETPWPSTLVSPSVLARVVSSAGGAEPPGAGRGLTRRGAPSPPCGRRPRALR